MNSEELAKIIAEYGLEELTKAPIPLESISEQSRYYLHSKKGKFLLTSSARVRKLDSDFNTQQQLEKIKEKIPTEIPCVTKKGLARLKINDSYYTLNHWITTDPQKPQEEQLISAARLLGDLHASTARLPLSAIPIKSSIIDLQLDENLVLQLLKKGEEHDSLWLETARQYDIVGFIREVNDAIERLSSTLIFGHGDYSPNHILWKNKKPILVNWDHAGYIHPGVELINALMAYEIFPQISMASSIFIGAYFEKAPMFQESFRDVILGALNKHYMKSIITDMQQTLSTTCDAELDDASERVIRNIENLFHIYTELESLSQHLESSLAPRIKPGYFFRTIPSIEKSSEMVEQEEQPYKTLNG